MTKQKPLILRPLPPGHVLRKIIDYYRDDDGRIQPIHGYHRAKVEDINRECFTTPEHWPADLECPWDVAVSKEPTVDELIEECGGNKPAEPPVPDELTRLKEQSRRQAEKIKESEAREAKSLQQIDKLVDVIEQLGNRAEAAELLAAEYKVRCEQLQASESELKIRNERQIIMVRDEYARCNELQRQACAAREALRTEKQRHEEQVRQLESEVERVTNISSDLAREVGLLRGENQVLAANQQQPLQWERRKPTLDECKTRWVIVEDDVACYRPDTLRPSDFSSSQKLVVLPDILPAVEPKRKVTEWFWLRLDEGANLIDHKWLEWALSPKTTGWHRTDKTRERVVE